MKELEAALEASQLCVQVEQAQNQELRDGWRDTIASAERMEAVVEAARLAVATLVEHSPASHHSVAMVVSSRVKPALAALDAATGAKVAAETETEDAP